MPYLPNGTTWTHGIREAFAIMQVSKIGGNSLCHNRKGILILIWIAGLGTLISGVIGVSNILLVTVRNGNDEIGVPCHRS